MSHVIHLRFNMSLLPCDESGYAIPAADLLCDALCECELLDPEWGDPLDWPAWTDQRFTLGPDPDELQLTSESDLEDLRHWERLEPFEPSPEDCDLLLDLEERRSYERGCNAHWIE